MDRNYESDKQFESIKSLLNTDIRRERKVKLLSSHLDINESVVNYYIGKKEEEEEGAEQTTLQQSQLGANAQ